MKHLFFTGLFLLFAICWCPGQQADSIRFQGQGSSWLLFNPGNSLPLAGGLRYIPELDYQLKFAKNRLLDFEFSVTIFGSAQAHPFDSLSAEGRIKPYRAWIRYSGEQFELRAGLQKINFGSAVMLRPLMWFDQIDPRDPLQLTDGVWGVLGRYYFLNNANLWLWGLMGNKQARPWETGNTNIHYPELGGRLQVPVPKGEMALSYHSRKVDTRGLGNGIPPYENLGENRLGLDGKWDLGVGLWFEGAWIAKTKNSGLFTHEEIMGVGTDYTFGIGNGLNAVMEHILVGFDEHAFQFRRNIPFSGLSLSYPLGMSDQLTAIAYYDWKGENAYTFVNWKHQWNKISIFVMGFLNPETYQLPQLQEGSKFFAGKGIQLMLVYTH